MPLMGVGFFALLGVLWLCWKAPTIRSDSSGWQNIMLLISQKRMSRRLLKNLSNYAKHGQ